jgi:hypothetical protein
LLDDEKPQEEAEEEEEAFVGFSTGKNKRVAVSDAALKKASALFEEPANGEILVNRRLNVNEDVQGSKPRIAESRVPGDRLSTKLTPVAAVDDEFLQHSTDRKGLKKLLAFGDEDSKSCKDVVVTPMNKPARVSISGGKGSSSAPRTKPFSAPRTSVNTPVTPLRKKDSFAAPVQTLISSKSAAPRPTNVSPVRPTASGFGLVASPSRSLVSVAGGPVLKTWQEEDYKRHGVRSSTQNLSFETSLGYRFDGGTVGPEWFRAELLKDGAVKEELLSLAWVENHYALIVWKLASMERSFPDSLGGLYLTKKWVLKQLQYRYTTEVLDANRPIFRKVAEKDDVATRYMVVVVTRVIDLGEDLAMVPPPVPVASKGDEEMDEKTASMILASFATIEVSDGWYVFRAKLDAKLTEHLAMGRIFPGLKLKICGARLQGVTEACPPLELPEGAFLALSVNGCRRASWHARLGLRLSAPFPVSIKSVQPGGGTIPRLDIVILRVMPLLFLEKDESTGRWMSHDSKAESDKQARMENEVSDRCSKRAEEMRAEFQSEDEQRRQMTRRKTAQQLQNERNEDVLYSAYLCNASLLDSMSEVQRMMVLQLERRITEERDTAVQGEGQLIMEKFQAQRQVTSFVEIEIADCPEVDVIDLSQVGRAVVQVYSPGEEMMETILREGKRLTVFGLEASRFKNDDSGRARFKSGKTTRWEEQSSEPIASFGQIYKPRSFSSLLDLCSAEKELAFDWIGSVLQVAPIFFADQVRYFFCDGSGDGLALVVEGPASLFKCNFEARGDLQHVQLRNLTYKSYDAHQRMLVAVASPRTEILKLSLADAARLAGFSHQISSVNERMKAFVGFSGPAQIDAKVGSFQMIAAVQPLLCSVYFSFPCVAVCLPSRGDVVFDPEAEWCSECGQTLFSSVYRPCLDGFVVALDNGVGSFLCMLPIRCLEIMLAVQSSARSALLSWIEMLLRTGRTGAEDDEFVCCDRLEALKKTKAGELATPATIVTLLLNCSVVGEISCSHANAAASLVTPKGIILTERDRCSLLNLLWEVLTAKKWNFVVTRPKNSPVMPPWRALDGEIESVNMVVDQVDVLLCFWFCF